MQYLTRQCWIIGLTMLAFAPASKLQAQGDSLDEVLLDKAWALRYEDPDSSIYLLDLCYQRFLQQGDTSEAIQVLMSIATVTGNQANYKASYDRLWTALFLADEINSPQVKIALYNRLGRYYSFYKRKDEALHYFNLSLALNKDLVAAGRLHEQHLVRSYYAFCATYRELDEPELAKIYLDSCLMFHQNQAQPPLPFLQFESAFFLKTQEKYQAALDSYEEILPWFNEYAPGYQVLVRTYMGDTYLGLGDEIQAEKQYKTALEVSHQYHSHKDFSPLIHQRLSDLYQSKGNYPAAYNSLKMVKTLDETFFDSRSENNRPLLEIQDAYRMEQGRIKELLREKRLTQLEHQQNVWFLQRIIFLVCLIFVILFSILYFNYVRSRHRSEKQMIKRERELELQNVSELVELKNKELATSTLKLIEKDEFLANLKDRLAQQQGDLDAKTVKQIVRSIKSSSSQNWEEFEARFIAVNQDFYQRLEHKFPKLTQGDKRLCALIKLDFSSKDMAKLIGISVESVHTNRYRLRKKLDLERDTNLTEFIATL